VSDKKIVPFGKYKGQPIEILQADAQYSDWLTQQQWFRERFADLFNMLSAVRGDVDTPEHNAMQVKFLDDGYLRAVTFNLTRKMMLRKAEELRSARETAEKERVNGEWLRIVQARAEEMLDQFEYENSEFFRPRRALISFNEPARAKLEVTDPRMERHVFLKSHLNYDFKWTDAAAENLFGYPISCGPLKLLPGLDFTSVSLRMRADFEVVGWDVLIDAEASWSEVPDSRLLWSDLAIELKPTMSDDFPAVLRQIKSRMKRGTPHAKPHLIVGEYTGIGATWDQVVAMFAASGIKCIFEREIDPSAYMPAGGK
jgi:hypothetical protein